MNKWMVVIHCKLTDRTGTVQFLGALFFVLFLSIGKIFNLLDSSCKVDILDAEVQLVVRAIMDVHGLGYQEQPQQQPQQQHQERRRAMLRTNISQRAQIRLPVFIDVMLRSVAWIFQP